jgi:hypothetical protein
VAGLNEALWAKAGQKLLRTGRVRADITVIAACNLFTHWVRLDMYRRGGGTARASLHH